MKNKTDTKIIKEILNYHKNILKDFELQIDALEMELNQLNSEKLNDVYNNYYK